MIYTKNMSSTTNFDSACVFTTFVKFKLFQDERFQNHSAKNLEMC